MISRLPKIKRHRVFRDFVWPSELPTFAQFNVIYGGNGSGKTTLSSLFGHLQDKRAITEGEVKFELDNGNQITGGDIPKVVTPPVRVFNRNFVAKTIEEIGESNVSPIYFLGAESIAQQKLVKELKAKLAAAQEAVGKATSEKRNTDKALDKFCVNQAKLIKEALLGSPQYANYDKRRFGEAVTHLNLKDKLVPPKTLSDREKKRLRKKKELQAKPSIPKISITIPDVEHLCSRTSELLKRTVVSQVIDELIQDPGVGSWVQQGLFLHKGEHRSNTCRFCGNELSSQRLAELEAHFNDAFASFQQDLEQAASDIGRQRDSLAAVIFPDESRFYDHLVGEIKTAVETSKQAISSVKKELDLFKDALEKKKETPFETASLRKVEPTFKLSGESLTSAIGAVDAIINKHEATTTNLTDEIKQASQTLEQNYVLEALAKFESLNKSVAEAEASLSAAKVKPAEINNQISTIEREIVEHRRPAEELNRELQAYLGRDELKFDVKKTGYALSRGGQPALHLSEGERTAIAFLYFLKSLEGKDFNISQGIVVIDDPVSSLDANALFSAFGYMKERTKGCHQLFILTHNFAFFRQVKNWFHHLKGQNKKKVAQRPGRFYALLAEVVDGERNAALSPLDPLLEQYESEYHFLFRQVHDVAHNTALGPELSQFYGMPNIARRLIETFLAYRFPDCGGTLSKRFDRAAFDEAKKTRILRLLNTYSHSGGISDPEHDPSVLAETREVMKVILELIQTLDDDHYQGMINLLQPVEEED